MKGDRQPIHVLIGGAFPKAGSMPGTWGRLLNAILDSPVFRGKVEFRRYCKTLPQDGNDFMRVIIEAKRFFLTVFPRPDVFHLHVLYRRSIYREYAFIRIAKLLGIKTVCDVRAGGLQYSIVNEHSKHQNRYLYDMFRISDEILVECKGDIDFIEKWIGRTAIHSPMIMPKKLFNKFNSSRSFPNHTEPIKIIYTGRYHKTKGLVTMLDAMPILSQQKRRVEFHLVGSSDDEDIKRKITEISANPPEGIVLIDHGWKDEEVFDLLSNCHIFAMLTTWECEGHPNSVLEAMSAGLSLILSEWKHVHHIVPLEHVKLVPPNDTKAFSDAVGNFIDNPESWGNASHASRTMVERKFLDTQICTGLIHVYEKLAKGVE